MGIKKYIANKDNTITNAYGVDLSTRATGSNMGAADILEVFSIYGQQTTTSAELSRVLVQFPISTISTDRTAGTIPASGSVKFYLRMFNARHSEQLPKDYTVNVLAVSQSWQEGYGLDMETYDDKTKDGIEGSNWIRRNSSPAASWGRIGGEYHSASYTAGETMPKYTYSFSDGEDMLLDVTAAVEEWIDGTQTNNGFGVHLTSSYEAYVAAAATNVLENTAGVRRSYYTKRFFSRSSEYFFKKPAIEARWDSRITDDRANFYSSSSVAPGPDNLNKLYLYNYIRGSLKDIPHDETLKIKLYASVDNAPAGNALANATAVKYSTGIYTASLAYETTSSVLHDIWSGSVGGEYKTGSIKVKDFNDTCVLTENSYPQFTTKIVNLRPSYSKDEKARFRVFTRQRNLSPTIYTVANSEAEVSIMPSSSFEIIRIVDEKTVIQNSTGSANYHTFLSYDNSGNYFDLDMSLLEPGYMYGIKLAFYTSEGWREQEEVHKFRVENN